MHIFTLERICSKTVTNVIHDLDLLSHVSTKGHTHHFDGDGTDIGEGGFENSTEAESRVSQNHELSTRGMLSGQRMRPLPQIKDVVLVYSIFYTQFRRFHEAPDSITREVS